MVLGELSRQFHGGVAREKFEGELVEVAIDGQSVTLLAPHTFMNASGSSVRAAVDFYRLPVHDVLVVCDDYHLPLGKLRLRARGSSGGQKGLADVIRQINTEEIHRLRIGVGPVPERWEPVDFVLSKFSRDERQTVEDAVRRAADAVTCWVSDGIAEAMNKYN
jgi:PTH1 family peptidyl-tRNA hydrolase